MNLQVPFREKLFAAIVVVATLVASACTSPITPKFQRTPEAVKVGNLVTFEDTTPETVTGWLWALNAKPSGSQAELSSTSEKIVTMIADRKGFYKVSLRVQQNEGDIFSNSTFSEFVVEDNPLTADAGPDQLVNVEDTVVLDGSNSSEASGALISYRWELLSGPSSTGLPAHLGTNATEKFVMDEAGRYEIELLVESELNNKRDTVFISTHPPAITTFSPPVGYPGLAVTITGKNFSNSAMSGSDRGNTVSFNGVASTLILDVTGDSILVAELPVGASTGKITLTVNQSGESGSSVDDFEVLGPVAVAGQDQQVDVGTSVQLDGSSSSDHFGRQLTFSWELLSKPALSVTFFDDPSSAYPAFLMDEPGTYLVQLTVNVVGSSEMGRDTLQVISNPPEITGFLPQSGTTGLPVTINGKNFSNKPAGNLVFFNPSVSAQINGAASDQLMVEVPANAVTGPISVRIVETGQTVSSSQNFIVNTSGSNWTQVLSVTSSLYGIDFVDNQNGIAVGNAGKAFATNDGGLSWTPLTTGITETLWEVSFYSMDIGYACGDDGTILKTTDFGTNWTQLTSGTTRHLYGITAVNDTTAYVSGKFGAIRRTTDSGLSWQAAGALGGARIEDVWFYDENTGFVASHSSWIKRTLNGGQSWPTVYDGISGLLERISFVDSLNGFVVGSNGRIVSTIDGGANWTVQTSTTTEILRGVSFATPLAGFATGDLGTILRTTDGGLNWNVEVSGVPFDLYSVYTFDVDKAVIVGSSGTILLRQ